MGLLQRSGRLPGRIAFVIGLFLLLACDAPPPAGEADGVPVYDFLGAFLPSHARTEKALFRFDEGEPQAGATAQGWSYAERQGKRSVVWALGEESRLRVFVAHPRPLEVALTVSPLPVENAPPQTLELLVNDRPVATFALERQWKTYRAATTAPMWQAGDNELRFRYGWARRPGPHDARELSVAWDELRIGSAAPDVPEPQVRGAGLVLPLASRVDYFLEVPSQALLEIGAVDGWGEKDGAVPVDLRVEVELRGEPPRVAFSGTATGSLQVPLGVAGRTIARVSFAAVPAAPGWLSRLQASLSAEEGTPGATSPSGLVLKSPVLRASSPEGGDPGGGHEPLDRGQPNLVIYLVDTLRADHLGCYGYQLDVSPHLDRFASDAILFANAYASAPWTRASVASLFTGLHPHAHRAVGRKTRLEDELQTLAESLKERGYETAGFVTNGVVSPSFGFGQGFDHYELVRETDLQTANSAEALNQTAFRWLDARNGADRPFLLYLHAADPHGPYTPREPWRSRFAAGADPTWEQVANLKQVDESRKEQARADAVSLYDAEIAENDHAFGALVERLRALGLYDDAMILFVSDHGEEFLDHGKWEHSHTLYQELLHVPFVLKLPGNAGAGRKVSQAVRLVDFMPTVLDWTGAPIPPGVEGESLSGMLLDGASGPGRGRVALGEILGRKREAHAIVIDGQKLIRWSGRHAKRELYDLNDDPHERQNRIAEEPILAAFLAGEIDRRVGTARFEAAPDAEISAELEEHLRALGYVQ